jgi:hypothetical protein
MVKKTFLVLICFIGLIIFISTLHGQGSKKTITLPSGEVVCDLNGEWDVFVENYGQMVFAGSYPQIWKITQTGSSFVAIRIIDDRWNQKGTRAVHGEVDKSGIKKVTIHTSMGPLDGKGQILEDWNMMIIDDGEKHRATAVRK